MFAAVGVPSGLNRCQTASAPPRGREADDRIETVADHRHVAVRLHGERRTELIQVGTGLFDPDPAVHRSELETEAFPENGLDDGDQVVLADAGSVRKPIEHEIFVADLRGVGGELLRTSTGRLSPDLDGFYVVMTEKRRGDVIGIERHVEVQVVA
jgi:hypothetical protein